MPLRKNIRWQPVAQPSTAGAAMDSEMVPFPRPSGMDQLRGLAAWDIPTPILGAILEEGVNFPFYTRWTLGVTPPQQNYNSKRALTFHRVIKSAEGLGTPLPVLASPPDTFPLFVGKHFELAGPNIARQRRLAYDRAGRATQEAPGSWIEIIPATEYTVTVCSLMSEIQEHLLETVNGGVTWSSGLWTTTEVVAYFNHRISRFLLETGVIQVRSTQPVTAAGNPFQDLPTDLIDLRRAAWTNGSTTTVLPRIDSFQADIWESGWESGGSPQASMLVPERSLELRIVPQPDADGILDLTYVRNAPPITNDCSIMPIPDEWTPFIKWGVISDMLSKEGEANDPQRATYAEGRWEEGIALAKLYLGGPTQ